MKGSHSKKLLFLSIFGLVLAPSLFSAQKNTAQDKFHPITNHVSKLLTTAAINPDAFMVDNVDVKAFEKEEECLAKRRANRPVSNEEKPLYYSLAKDIEIIKAAKKNKKFLQKLCKVDLAKYLHCVVHYGEDKLLETILLYIPTLLHKRDKKTGESLLHTAVRAPTYEGQEDMVLQLLVEGIDPLAVDNKNNKASDYIMPEFYSLLKSGTSLQKDIIDIISNYCVVPEEVRRFSIIHRTLLECEEDALKKFQHADQQYNDMLLSLEHELLTLQPKKKNKKPIIAAVATAAASHHKNELVYDQKKYSSTATQPLTQNYSTATVEQDMTTWQAVVPKAKLPAHAKTINGRVFTVHALERMAPNTPEIKQRLEARALRMGFNRESQEFRRYVEPRNITSKEVEDVIKKAKDITTRAEVIIYSFQGIKVVLNLQGAVVTVIRTVDQGVN